MARQTLRALMTAAAEAGVVVPAFNIPYLPMVEPTCRALERLDVFGMVEVARLELTKFEAQRLGAVHELFTRYASPRHCSLHLDHVPVIDEDNLECDWQTLIAEGIALGYDSVMIDGSRLPLDENIAVTAQVVSMAHADGALVEAELGAVLGHSEGPMPPYDELFAKRIGFTDPDEAAEFVRRTGVDWLSVSVGSFHGAISMATKDQPKRPAKLDIEHLRRLREVTGIPLVLHGGSGVIREYVHQAIAAGMVKINIATDTRQPYERAVAAGASREAAQRAVEEAIERLVREQYGIAGSATRLHQLAGLS